MAGDWIPMRHDLAEDPAVLALSSELDLDVDTVVGRLHRLWCWADRQTTDGHAAGVTFVTLERALRCDGFVSAVARAGWIAETEGGVAFVNFDRWISESAKKRLQAARRQRLSRSERDKSVTTGEDRRVRGEKRVAAAVGGVPPLEERVLPNGNSQSARALQEEDMDVEDELQEVREAWERLRRLFGETKHDPVLVAEVRTWVRGWGPQAEDAVTRLIGWARTKKDQHAMVFHAIHHGYADEKIKLRRVKP